MNTSPVSANLSAPFQRAGWHPAVFALAAALVLLAPLFRGGNRYVPLMLLEALAAAVLLGLAWRALSGGRAAGSGSASAPGSTPGSGSGAWRGWSRWALWALLGAPLWVALWQLLPLPAGLWNGLPGRADFSALPGAAPAAGWRAASLTPEATWAALLAGLPIVACLALALTASARQLGALCRLWVAAAVLQALWGLLQLGPFPGLYAGLVSPELVGSFASKNTYSNFLVMAIPLVVWELSGRGRAEAEDWSPPGRGQGRWLWGVTLFLLLATLLAATSRTGIATGLLVAMLAVALLPARGARRWAGLPWAFWGMALMIALALAAGGLAWLDRFEADRLLADEAIRALTREGTWQGALAFWPLGSGLGSYATVFPRFQAPELGAYLIDLAHSDYLQLLMELGALAPLLGAALLALLLRRAGQLRRAGRHGQRGGERQGQAADSLALAAGLGALAFALHAWVDYPMRIPANAIFAAFLIGVLLRQPSDDRGNGTY